jgi:hypothetical protein
MEVAEELRHNKDFLAYQGHLAEGLFSILKPGACVYYKEGKLLAVGANVDDVLATAEEVDEDFQNKSGFITVLGRSRQRIRLPAPKNTLSSM